MASFRYNTYKFRYSKDDNTTVIKVQRETIDPTTNETITPITDLFRTRVIDSPSKWEPNKDSTMRHAEAHIRRIDGSFSETKAYIPFKPGDVLLVDHLQEINNVENVECIFYVGEKRKYAKSNNSDI